MNWDAEMDRFYPDPQQEKATPVCECGICKADIYPGEIYYEIPGDDPICEDCITKFKYTA